MPRYGFTQVFLLRSLSAGVVLALAAYYAIIAFHQTALLELAKRLGFAVGWVWLAVFLAIIMFGWKTLPVKTSSSQLKDFMVEQSKFAKDANRQQIAKRILNKANQLKLPVTLKDIEVRKTAARVEMRCKYTVPIEFPLYTYNWNFDLFVERAIFYW